MFTNSKTEFYRASPAKLADRPKIKTFGYSVAIATFHFESGDKKAEEAQKKAAAKAADHWETKTGIPMTVNKGACL